MTKSQWITETNINDFETRVIIASNQQPILLDIWAEWCAPCLTIAPILEQVIDHFDGQLLLKKLEIDASDGENMKIAGQYKVKAFPTLILFHHGKPIDRFSRIESKVWIIRFIEKQNVLLV